MLQLFAYNIEETQDILEDSFDVLTTYTEYYDTNLEQQIYQRHKEGKFYEEAEIWHILYQIVSAAAALQSNYMNVGDIRPHTIFVSRNGTLKMWPQDIYPQEIGLYDMIRQK